MGDPPPMDSYAAIDFGARRLEIRYAIVFWRGARGAGRRIMSGSANRLYRNPGHDGGWLLLVMCMYNTMK